MEINTEPKSLRSKNTSGRREELKEHHRTDKKEAADREETRDTSTDQIIRVCVCVCVCVSEKKEFLQQ